jgi:hypothetical protein
MRVAAAYEALEEVRRHIRMRATLVVFLPNNMQGYHDATRSAASFKSLWALVDLAADVYQAHRSAVIALQGIAKLPVDLKQLDRKHLVPLNFYEDPATAKAIQEVIGRIVPLAQHDAPGNTGQEDEGGEADGKDQANLNVGPGGTQLMGALNHGLQRRAVPWIWLGANLKPGKNNRDPAGERERHSIGQVDLTYAQHFSLNGRVPAHELVAGMRSSSLHARRCNECLYMETTRWSDGHCLPTAVLASV